ncbi:hypothetical protein Q5O24_06950 [Eubacteriaceae bacterium ES3]|nr:hypothetical protein Q5O24_06950 [Eubacteriaceae bacterium ES3]
MKVNVEIFKKPKPFCEGNLTLWRNDYIAFEVLKKHLDSTIDSGSQKGTTIEKSVKWLRQKFNAKQTVLDIGCGPGLYAIPLYMDEAL